MERKSEAGKGDSNRIRNRRQYERNYVRIFGVICPVCRGKGKIHNPDVLEEINYETKDKRNS